MSGIMNGAAVQLCNKDLKAVHIQYFNGLY